MKKKIILGIIVVVLLFAGLSTLTIAKPAPKSEEINTLDPGGIRGPIWGRIRGYEYTGPHSDHLELDTIFVLYLGIGYAFDAGFYPRLYIFRDATFSYPNFEGTITSTNIKGTISGLP